MKDLEEKVKEELSKNYAYNFIDGLMPLETSLIVKEVIEATAKILNENTEKGVAKSCSSCKWHRAKFDYKCASCTKIFTNWEQDFE